jgi:hypothetical protein
MTYKHAKTLNRNTQHFVALFLFHYYLIVLTQTRAPSSAIAPSPIVIFAASPRRSAPFVVICTSEVQFFSAVSNKHLICHAGMLSAFFVVSSIKRNVGDDNDKNDASDRALLR